MKKKYIMGVDGGSQSSKVVIFDLEGNIVCEGKEDLRPMNLGENTLVEHPDDDLWDSLAVAGRRAMEQFAVLDGEIIAVGLCTIRFCRALLKADGSLASPVMSWMDARVSRPYEHVNDQVRYVTTTSGYITHRLTGQFNDTVANYMGQWPLDTDKWQWSEDDEVIRALNIPRAMLFNLQMPGTVLGYVTEKAAAVTGIPAGVPVVATANDKAVEALGAGLVSDKKALISLGTYIASMVNGSENPQDVSNFWTNFSSMPRQYLYESYGIRRGMWTVSWWKNILGDEVLLKAEAAGLSPEEYMNREAAKVPAGSEGLMTVLDWLAPTSEPHKRGVMIGFDARHGRYHIYRSIIEAIALTMKSRFESMCEELGNKKVEQVIISGGGANSDLIMQIFADVLNLPTVRNRVSGSASLGSAVCAAVAVGAYGSFEEAIERMVSVRDTFLPQAENAALYQRMSDEVYQGIALYTDEVLKKSHPIFA